MDFVFNESVEDEVIEALQRNDIAEEYAFYSNCVSTMNENGDINNPRYEQCKAVAKRLGEIMVHYYMDEHGWYIDHEDVCLCWKKE